MEKSQEIALLEQSLELTRSGQPFMSGDEKLIPVDEYLDEDLFQAEYQTLFRRSANLVAHSSQIASPGDFITRDLAGTPAILVRGKDGKARAFVNVCRHRGATVEPREKGNCRKFVCPYHAWGYATDGTLSTVPHKAGFPALEPGHSGLVPLACYEAAGFIWVCSDHAVRECSPDEPTRALAKELVQLGCAEMVVFDSQTRIWNANWKILVDGGLEAYHFKVLHRDTVAPFFNDNVSTFEMLGDHVRSVLPRVSILDLEQQARSEWDLRKHTHLVYSIFPGATVLMQEGHFDLILMTPVAVDRTRIEIAAVVPKPDPDGYSEKERGFWSANHEFTKATLAEDFALGEQIQRGLCSGANESFRFARFEGALTEWHRRIDTRLGR